MNIILTICSANYVAHAKTLGDSVAAKAPGCRFVIGLVDSLTAEVVDAIACPYEIIPAEALGSNVLQPMVDKYNIVELNTAVKPFFIEHLYRIHSDAKSVVYLDPDIVVFTDLADIFARLENHDLIFTPHNCSFDDSDININYELAMLSTGVYNLGFLATRRSPSCFEFLAWWQKRLIDHCYYRPGTGVFVDQLWTILAPVYFEGSFVEKSPGYNMAYWNLFERTLQQRDNGYVVNGTHPLVFYHFSNYSPNRPDTLARRNWPRVPTFDERPEMRPLFETYRLALLRNGFKHISTLPCRYYRRPQERPSNRLQRMISLPKRAARSGLHHLPSGIKRALGRAGRFVASSCLNGTEA
jgi:hypothetical protein